VLKTGRESRVVSKQKTILVIESENLLTAAIISLLTSRPEFDVKEATFSSLALLDGANHTNPDVIIMDEELVASQITAVISLVNRYPKLRLLVLSLSDNRLHVFDKQIVYMSEVSDFIAQLQNIAS